MTDAKPGEGASATPDEPPLTTDEGKAAPEAPMPFKQFLETVHPSVTELVSDLWVKPGRDARLLTPDLRLHCETCDGERTFRCSDRAAELYESTSGIFIRYLCGDCHQYVKLFSLEITMIEKGLGVAYKYGESAFTLSVDFWLRP